MAPSERSRASGAPPAPRGGLRIGAVARLTGISAHALRMWERRYGALATGRSRGGNRLFSDADVARLRLLRQLTDYGHGIGQIVGLEAGELERLLAEHRAAPAPSWSAAAVRDRFLAAIEAMDLVAAESMLAHAQLALGPRELALDVVPAILAEVGVRWQAERVCVAHEHAASALVRSQLGTMLHAFAPPPGAPVVVVATPSGELHELGALLAASVASMSGWRAMYLGASLPAAECARAVRQSHARALALSVVALDPAAARDAIAEVARELPPDAELLVGGASGTVARELPARARVLGALDEAERWFRAAAARGG